MKKVNIPQNIKKTNNEQTLRRDRDDEFLNLNIYIYQSRQDDV